MHPSVSVWCLRISCFIAVIPMLQSCIHTGLNRAPQVQQFTVVPHLSSEGVVSIPTYPRITAGIVLPPSLDLQSEQIQINCGVNYTYTIQLGKYFNQALPKAMEAAFGKVVTMQPGKVPEGVDVIVEPTVPKVSFSPRCENGDIEGFGSGKLLARMGGYAVKVIDKNGHSLLAEQYEGGTEEGHFVQGDVSLHGVPNPGKNVNLLETSIAAQLMKIGNRMARSLSVSKDFQQFASKLQ